MLTLAARGRLLMAGVAAIAASALLAAPASAASDAAHAAAGCPDVPVAQPFAPWGDTADYFLVANGDLEHGASHWKLRGDADIVRGNEPFHVVAASDRRSLRLAAGSSATTAPFCIGVEHRSMRFFAQGAASGSLDVDVLYSDARGANRTLRIGTVGGAGEWAPTDTMAMVVNELAAGQGNAMSVSLRFAPRGTSAWAIDDVHVDPYRSR